MHVLARCTQLCAVLGASGLFACSQDATSPAASGASPAVGVPVSGAAAAGVTGAAPRAGARSAVAGSSGTNTSPTSAGASAATAGSVAAVGGGAGASVNPPVAGAATASASGTGGAPAAQSGAGADAVATVSCPTSSLKAGDTPRTVMVGGTARKFILHVPASYAADQPAPLVVDLHPLGQTADFQRGNSGYRELSEEEGFIVAWPQGIQNVWNVGPCCTESREVDDVGFAKALVTDVSSQVCVDPKRVYADGYSMGGGMAHYLACHAADVFAAVAPSAFDLLEENSPDCKPSRPITEITFRGTSDLIAPYRGGASTPPVSYPLPQIHFLGAEGTFKRWAELNECTGTPTATSGGCETYTTCKAGVEVTLCTTQGGGHVTGDAKIGWEMLKKHPMP